MTMHTTKQMIAVLLSAGCALGACGPQQVVPFGGDPSKVERVGGDAEAQAELTDRGWRAGDSLIDTPLPENYPAPTPPGAIEIKRYDVVRRAEVETDKSYGQGQRGAFWPLFRHISDRGIAMTSPVEMDMNEWSGDPSDAPGEWTMAFLYRVPEDGGLEDDGRVRVVDSEPVTMLSIGLRGPYRMSSYAEGLEQLDAWLAEQDEWERVGGPRVLGYHGPMTPASRRWSEVQVPVQRAASDEADDDQS